VPPARYVRGRLKVPGDKAISHRYAIIAALANGPSRLSNYAPGADCHSTLACLRALGVSIIEDGTTVTLMGRGLGRLSAPTAPLDAGNSGTTMRMMAGVLAAHPFTTTMTGDESLSRRPMRRVIEPLGMMGCRIESRDSRPPLTIHGTTLKPIAYTSATPSAQVKSAILFAGLHTHGTTSVAEPSQTRDHTEQAFRAFGGTVRVEDEGRRVSIDGPQALAGQQLTVPGDFSSAAFWMVAAAARPGSRVELEDVGLNPSRTALLGVLKRFGARVSVDPHGDSAGEPRGTITVEGDRIGRIDIAPEEVPGLIDELPAIAALAGHGAEVSVRGAAELRVKETDRIAALVAGLRRIVSHESPIATAAMTKTCAQHQDNKMANWFIFSAPSGFAQPRPALLP